jgi:hypothetical protein
MASSIGGRFDAAEPILTKGLRFGGNGLEMPMNGRGEDSTKITGGKDRRRYDKKDGPRGNAHPDRR